MTTPEHLTNAPITEALIDIRVVPKEGLGIERLAAIHTRIADQYPTKRTRKKFEGQIKLDQGGAPEYRTVDLEIDRYLFISADGKQIVQIGLDGFTFSILQPYETWERLRDEARRLWQIYLEEAAPEFVARIAVRYINQLTIPLPIRDYAEWLTAPPNVPKDLTVDIDSFLTRIVVKDPSIDSIAIITQAREQEVEGKATPIMLDIDSFRTSQNEAADPQIWDYLEQLRSLKNRIFFQSITDKTKGLFI